MRAANNDSFDLSHDTRVGGDQSGVSSSRGSKSIRRLQRHPAITAEDCAVRNIKPLPIHNTQTRSPMSGPGGSRLFRREEVEEKQSSDPDKGFAFQDSPRPFRSRHISTTTWHQPKPSWFAKMKPSRKKTKGIEEINSKQHQSTVSSLAQPKAQPKRRMRNSTACKMSADPVDQSTTLDGLQGSNRCPESIGCSSSQEVTTSTPDRAELERQRIALEKQLELTQKRLANIDCALRESERKVLDKKKNRQAIMRSDQVFERDNATGLTTPPDSEASSIENGPDEESTTQIQYPSGTGMRKKGSAVTMSPRSIVAFHPERVKPSPSCNKLPSGDVNSPPLPKYTLTESHEAQSPQVATSSLSKPRSTTRFVLHELGHQEEHGATEGSQRGTIGIGQERRKMVRFHVETDKKEGSSVRRATFKSRTASRYPHLLLGVDEPKVRGPTNPRTPQTSLDTFFKKQRIPVAVDLPRSEDGDTISRSTAESSENAISIYDSRYSNVRGKKNALLRHEKRATSATLAAHFQSGRYAPVATDNPRSVGGESISISSAESNSLSIYDANYEAKKALRCTPRGKISK